MANTFEVTKFGDGVSTTRVSNVSNRYGPVETGGAKGVVATEGSNNELSVTFNGSNASAGALDLETDLKVPAGAVIKSAYLKVTEAFVIGGTSATVLVGTDGSEVTNGLVATEAQLEAVGTYDLTSTLTGTWDAPLAAAATVGIALGGTSPTSTSAGKAKLIVEYAVVGAA